MLSLLGFEKLLAEGEQYTIRLFSNEYGRCQGSGIYDIDDVVTIQAIPNENCYFVGWFTDDEYQNLYSVNPEIEITISDHLELYANFQQQAIYNLVDENINLSTNNILYAILIVNCMIFFTINMRDYM